MREYYVTVPYSVIKLGGLHIWTYIGIQMDYPNGFGTSLRGYTPQTMAVKLEMISDEDIERVGKALEGLSTLDFLDMQRQDSMYVVDTKTARAHDGDIKAPLWCIEKILVTKSGDDFWILENYFKGEVILPGLKSPSIFTEKMPWEDEDYKMPDDVSKRLHTSKNILPSSAMKSGWTAASAADIDDILPFN